MPVAIVTPDAALAPLHDPNDELKAIPPDAAPEKPVEEPAKPTASRPKHHASTPKHIAAAPPADAAVAEAPPPPPDAAVVAKVTEPTPVVPEPPKAPARTPVVSASLMQKVAGELPTIRGDVDGDALVKMCIDASGAVTSVKIVRATAQMPPDLTRALQGWQYKPYTNKDGKAQPVCFALSLRVEVKSGD